MVATLLHNRIAGVDSAPARAPLPDCERERGRLWNDAVLKAVLALQKQLGSLNEEIVAAAANSILELERTRMRHDKTVSGTRTDPSYAEPPDAEVEREHPEFTEEEKAIVEAHAREVRASAEGPMTEGESVAFVIDKLGRWEIRPGEFGKMLKLMGDRVLL